MCGQPTWDGRVEALGKPSSSYVDCPSIVNCPSGNYTKKFITVCYEMRPAWIFYY